MKHWISQEGHDECHLQFFEHEETESYHSILSRILKRASSLPLIFLSFFLHYHIGWYLTLLIYLRALYAGQLLLTMNLVKMIELTTNIDFLSSSVIGVSNHPVYRSSQVLFPSDSSSLSHICDMQNITSFLISLCSTSTLPSSLLYQYISPNKLIVLS